MKLRTEEFNLFIEQCTQLPSACIMVRAHCPGLATAGSFSSKPELMFFKTLAGMFTAMAMDNKDHIQCVLTNAIKVQQFSMLPAPVETAVQSRCSRIYGSLNLDSA